MAARYSFGGKDDMKGQPAITAGRYVVGGGFKGKGRNNLRDTLDKYGKVNDFLNHDDSEMVVPANLSRPGPNMATRPSWPKLSYFGQKMMKKKEDDDEKGNQESFTPADNKAEDSSKKPNNFWPDQDDVDFIVPNKPGSNPYPNNNNVIKPTNFRGTAMDPPTDDKQRHSHGVNNTSSNKDNSNQVKESNINCYTMNQGSPYPVDFGPNQLNPPYCVDLGLKQSGPPSPVNLSLKQPGPSFPVDLGPKQSRPPYSVDLDPKQPDSLYPLDLGEKQHGPPSPVDAGPKQLDPLYPADLSPKQPSPSYFVDLGPKQHSDYVSGRRDQNKKQNMEIAGFNSKTSITQDSPPMHRANGFPNINWQDKDDESKKKNIAPTPRPFVSNKPNISNGLQDYYYNRAQRWIGITPNPPPQPRYGGAYPNLQPVYPRRVIDSKRAKEKYNGVLLTDNYEKFQL